MKAGLKPFVCAFALLASLGCGGGGGDGGGPDAQRGPLDDSVWSGQASSSVRQIEGVAALGDLRVAFVLDAGLVSGVSLLNTGTSRIAEPIDGALEGNHVEFTFGDFRFAGDIPEDQSAESASLIVGSISSVTTELAASWAVELSREGTNDAPESISFIYAGVATSLEGNGEADITVYTFEDQGYLEGEFWVGDAVANYSAALIDNDFVTGEFEFEETGETGIWTGTIDALKGISGDYAIFDGPTLVDQGSFSISPDPMNQPPGGRRSLNRRVGGKIGERP